MSEPPGPTSDLVHISQLNGDFRRNYGLLLGAYLYLRSIDAVHQRPFRSIGVVSLIASAVATAVARYGHAW
jgi:hypothetical protein